jgi:hypothetical protein
MNLLIYQKVYVKDAIIDRIIKIESKIKTIKDSFEYNGRETTRIRVHVQGLEHELSCLCDIKRGLEQEIYNSAHNV